MGERREVRVSALARHPRRAHNVRRCRGTMGAARRQPLAPPPDHTAPHAGVYLTQPLLLLSRSKQRNFAHLAACPWMLL